MRRWVAIVRPFERTVGRDLSLEVKRDRPRRNFSADFARANGQLEPRWATS